MSRQSVPNLEPTDLRDDLATDERVDRIWGRLEQELVTARVKPVARPSRTAVWALAATFAAFGVGLFAGRIVWREQPTTMSPVLPTNDRTTVDVFAAGTQERTYALPGGGTITLAPGSTIELERSGGSNMQLRLVSGEASIDTVQGSQQSLAIVSGEATVATAPGSVVNVSQRADNLDVRVVGGSAEVSSPAGTRALRKGDQMNGVPTHTTSAIVAPPVGRVASARTAHSTSANEPPVAQVAVAPGWRELHRADNFAEAVAELKKQGGIGSAVQNAKSDGELMALSDLARWKGTDPSAGMLALRRVADEFGSTQNGVLAAKQLGQIYDNAGQPELAKKYRDQAGAQKGVMSEDALCDQMRAEHKNGHKDEAARRASEYLGKYPNGRCKDEARSIQSGDAAEDVYSPSDDAPAAPTSSASSTAPVPAPKP